MAADEGDGPDRSGLSGTLPIGRETEVDRILRSIDGPCDPPHALLMLGEAGTGKTQLLRVAEERARGHRTRVLSAQGWGSEGPLSFASLHQLLLPVLGELDALPEHQRLALRTAFGPAPDARPPEVKVLRAAVLTLLIHLARASPVLLTVDDIQDCDRDSMEILYFVTRRLTDQAVTVLFTARGEAPPAGAPADLAVLCLGPLSRRAAARLLDAQPGAPTGRARLDLLRQAEGHPLSVIELSRAARGGTGPSLAGAEAQQTSRIQQMFATHLGVLPEGTQRALLYAAAASHHEELTTVMAALGTHDLKVWVPAEEAGLITVADGRLAFRDPLIRTAAFHRQCAKQRQQAHRDLAAVRGQNPSHRAWHLAAAATGPDESAAAALEDVATTAEQGGECFAAAKALEQAARLSPLDHDRARRLAGALTAASVFGDPAWVRDLYALLTRVTRDPDLVCSAACALSGALSLLSFQQEAFDLLLSVSQHTPPGSATTAFALAALATGIAFQSGLPEHRQQLPRLLDQAVRAARTEKDRCGQEDRFFPELAGPDVLAALEALMSTGIEPAAHTDSALRRLTIPRLNTSDGRGRLIRLMATASVAYYADVPDLCAEQFRQADGLLRRQEALGPRAWTLATQVDTLLSIGRWAEAETLIEEGLTYAVVHRWTRVEMDLEALGATLRALLGESVSGIQFTGSNWRSVSLDENRATHARMLRACGLTAMALGDGDSAFRHLRALFGDDGSPLDPFLSPRSISELAAAAQRVGRQQEAARILMEVRERQGPRPTTRMTLLMHHAAALVDDDADPEHHFRLALVNPEADKWPLERAQARLHYAIWLRRRRRPLEARTQLTAVLEVATRLGARHLAASARSELRASGVAHAPASADRLAELTAQQQQIARLAANGLSNREIGERLFLSPRTVGSHLYNVYPKLGISSRHQLRDILLRDG
ncbi:helix-turn-helix transcriptional regulator [Streptomyces atratus]|uniref:helix-turn-helix transcriptional regulator n=1 Tax=Streptomyces atratus TaxID=1893 RepID=UPI001E62575F|nr:LuxR family transcriptional regulator [Streptomyces atratus]